MFTLGRIFLPVLAVVLGTAAGASGDEWPVHHHDNQRTSRSTSGLIPASLQHAWTAPPGYRTPVIIGNSVIATNLADITAFNLADGTVQWSTPANLVQSTSNFAVGSGLLTYVHGTLVGNTFTWQLRVHDAATGAYKYEVPIPSGVSITMSTDPATQQPVAYVDAPERITAVALGPSSGQVLWSSTGINGGGGGSSILGDSLLVNSIAHYYAVNRTTGAVRQFRDGNFFGPDEPPPVVDITRNQFYVLIDDDLEAFSYDGNGGPITPLWSRSGACIEPTLALDAQGYLYSANSALLVKIDPATGGVVDSEPGNFFIESPTLVSDGYVWEFGRGPNLRPLTYAYHTSDLSLAHTITHETQYPSPAYRGRSVVDDFHFIFDNNLSGFMVYSGVPEPSAIVAGGALLTAWFAHRQRRS